MVLSGPAAAGSIFILENAISLTIVSTGIAVRWISKKVMNPTRAKQLEELSLYLILFGLIALCSPVTMMEVAAAVKSFVTYILPVLQNLFSAVMTNTLYDPIVGPFIQNLVFIYLTVSLSRSLLNTFIDKLFNQQQQQQTTDSQTQINRLMKKNKPSPREIKEMLAQIDIVGYEEQVKWIMIRVFLPRLKPQLAKALNIDPPKGVLLWGPPGTGKSTLAANLGNCHGNITVADGPSLKGKWYGETEANIRNLFVNARKDQQENGEKSGLHIVIFDEFEALASTRKNTQSPTDSVNNSIVSTLLTTLQGVEDLKNVIIIATTNRPEEIDPALLRPGRIDVKIEMPRPNEKAREAIFRKYLQPITHIEGPIDITSLARQTQHFVGADIKAVISEASTTILQSCFDAPSIPDDENAALSNLPKLTQAMLEQGIARLKPGIEAAVAKEKLEKEKAQPEKTLPQTQENVIPLLQSFFSGLLFQLRNPRGTPTRSASDANIHANLNDAHIIDVDVDQAEASTSHSSEDRAAFR